MSTHKVVRMVGMLGVALRQRRELKAYLSVAPVKTELQRAALVLGGLHPSDPRYAMRVAEFDSVMTVFHQAKFLASRASGTRDSAAWRAVREKFETAKALAVRLREELEAGSAAAVPLPAICYEAVGEGMVLADGVPLVPSINPIVVLRGSSREMGRQYALQLVRIYGPWILSRKAGRRFDAQELSQLRLWEKQLAEHAPEILEMVEGWVEGAAAAGVAMSRDEVLEIWTGALPPERDYMGSGGKRFSKIPPLACSGAAAWGRATVDGRLCTASAGDFDPTFTATILAYPDTGNAFVYTPFGATGDVPGLGSVNMFGHPGLNSRGLAYVHHGGTPKMIEPKQTWGHGLRRACGVLHILRFCDSAAQAREVELAFPVGDAGLDSGTVGGFWADDSGGCVVESRRDPQLVREAGLMGETDFLYSANSPIHPEVAKHGWMRDEAKRWEYDERGGWTPRKFSFFHKLGLVYWGSARRGRAFFEMMDAQKGQLDFAAMVRLYSTPGTLPEGDWKTISRTYRKTGAWGRLMPGNASNGVLVFMKPSEGRYSVCLGQLRRGMPPTSPLFASSNPIRDEANAYWDLQLAGGPEESVAAAALTAARLSTRAVQAASGCTGCQHSAVMAQAAAAELARDEGHQAARTALSLEGEERLLATARALRAYTRAHVRARKALRLAQAPGAEPEWE